METVLFTDHSVVVFAIVTGALALTFSVLGLATTSHLLDAQFCNRFGQLITHATDRARFTSASLRHISERPPRSIASR